MESDPIRLVKRLSKPADIEIAAWIVSALAFGQVSQIIRAGERALALMGNEPEAYIRSFNAAKESPRWKYYYYRMVRGWDMIRWLTIIKIILERDGSLEIWARNHYRPSDEHLGFLWSRAVRDIMDIDRQMGPARRSSGVGFRHLFPDPAKGGACKRAFLFLRWMVRDDAVDFGLWKTLPKNKLLIPLDTHILWTSRHIGLTRRNDSRLLTAIDITNSLRQLDPHDPVKYDFALTRLGILKQCVKKYHPDYCPECPVRSLCRVKKINEDRAW